MDQKHKKNKRTLQILGCVFTVLGLALMIAGFVDFFVSVNNSDMPGLFFLLFLGFPLVFVGICCLTLGFRKEMARYVKNEAVPVINEASSELKPTISNIGQALKEGLTDDPVVCQACGVHNDKDGKFCKNCGKPLTKICPDCNTDNDQDSKFCKNCGKLL